MRSDLLPIERADRCLRFITDWLAKDSITFRAVPEVEETLFALEFIIAGRTFRMLKVFEMPDSKLAFELPDITINGVRHVEPYRTTEADHGFTLLQVAQELMLRYDVLRG